MHDPAESTPALKSELMAEQTEVLLSPGSISILTLKSPCGLNLLRVEAVRSLLRHLQDLRKQADLRVLILTGHGQRAFCAGADMRELLGLSDIPAYVELGQELCEALESFPVPVIAAINGFALGAGFSLAMACDLRVVADTARIGQLAVNNGLVPPFGNIQRILQICGVARGRELIFTGRILKAAEAEKYFLANRVVAPDQLLSTAIELAQTIQRAPSRAIRLSKAIIERTLSEGHAVGYALQEEALIECLAAPESREIMQGFLDKE